MNKKSDLIKQNWHFQDLMLYRVHEILLIASPYDAYILEQDGKLTEQILSEYIGMNLSYAPRVWNTTSGKSAIEMLSKRNFDLVIRYLKSISSTLKSLMLISEESDGIKFFLQDTRKIRKIREKTFFII